MPKGNTINYLTTSYGKKTEKSRDKTIDRNRKISPNKEKMEIKKYIQDNINNKDEQQ